MNKFTAACLLAVAIASPALAAQTHGKATAKSKIAHPAAPGTVGYVNGQPHSIYVHKPEYDVYVNGEYVGSDPDPAVRYQLRRDWCQDSWDGC